MKTNNATDESLSVLAYLQYNHIYKVKYKLNVTLYVDVMIQKSNCYNIPLDSLV